MGSEDSSRWKARWYVFPAVGALAVGLLLGLRVFVYQPFSFPSVAMSPTINAGDDFLVSKWSYRSADPARGDLVVFYARNVANADYLKRVVGLPGDDIQLRNGVLFINGKATHLHRTGESSVRCGDTVCHYVQFEEMLPGGRSYQIQRLAVVTDVENTTVYRVPPDHYFVLGDNRDNSLDSRMSVGFVARNDIVGRAAVRYWDGAKQRPVLESLN